METLKVLFDENASWHTLGQSPISGDLKSREALIAQFGWYGGETAGTFKAKLLQMLKCEDGSIGGTDQNTAEHNGKSLNVRYCDAFELKDGRVLDGKQHYCGLYA